MLHIELIKNETPDICIEDFNETFQPGYIMNNSHMLTIPIEYFFGHSKINLIYRLSKKMK